MTADLPRIPMKVGNITRRVAGAPGESRQGGTDTVELGEDRRQGVGFGFGRVGATERG